MAELKSRFPEGIDYTIAYDITPFVRESVNDVVRTLLEAVVLVGLVVLVFLQNWRAVLIPLIAVPVAIIGTFSVMAIFSFSLNNISLFGLVLAIGIVVDDAIVVVENVERWLDQGLSPREATRKAMEEVTGPVVAVALVLCAVFVPCGFISGITGRFFLQFAITISVSTVFSAINSLTLSPALAAILLRPRDSSRDPLTWLMDTTLGWFFRLFNSGFEASTEAYGWVVGKLLRLSLLVLLGYGGLLVLTYWVFRVAPTGFVPDQDQGRVIANVQLPDSSSLERTQELVAAIDKIALETPGVAHTVTISGMSFVLSATSSNFASMFIVLDPFDKRTTPDLHDTAIMAHLRRECAKQVKDAQVMAFGAPPIPGLSVAGGFKLLVEDRGGLGLQSLQRQTDGLIRKLQAQPGLTGVSTQFRSNAPQLFMDIDREKVESLGLSVDDVNQTLAMYVGSLYVNSFNSFGRHWQVTIQAEGSYRSQTEDLNLLKVRSKAGQMVSLGTLFRMREIGGPAFVTRYNLSVAAPITGNLRPGVSSGDAIAATETLATQTLPISMKTEWTELMFMQIRAGNTAIYVFLLAILCVFLALAALYESWSLPLAVILVVPLCLLCSVAGVLWTGSSVNIFVQIGLVVLVGLACKNAILIVEFAKQLHQEGQPRFEATQDASQQRLRPILMTSFAFILGVVPLVVANGAGAEMRRSLGTAVFSGMIGVTLFGIFLTPVFFYVIQGLGETRLFSSRLVQRLALAGMIVLGVAVLGIPALGIPKRIQLAALIIAVLGIPSVMLVRSLQQPSCRSRRPTKTPSKVGGGSDVISHFFIDRPIFASVLSIVFVLAGGVAVFTLPVAQYPDVTPPTVVVTALYPGANALTVRDTVAAPIEEQVSGVEGMMYMSSQSTNDGAYTLTVTFRMGTDSDMAQVLVQNRVSLALPVIPQLVQNEGINVKKMSPNTLMIVNLVSPKDDFDSIFLSNYATIYLKDELGRLPGVAGITYLGQRDYSLRAWLDPDKLASLNLTAMDVVTAISQQNLQVAAGQIGQQPVPKGQQFQLTINTLGRLTDPEQFASIILKAGTANVNLAGIANDRRRTKCVDRTSHGDGSGRAGKFQHIQRTNASIHGHRPVARCGQRRARFAAVQPILHAGRQAVGCDVHLPASRIERTEHSRWDLCQDEGAEEPLPRRPRLSNRL